MAHHNLIGKLGEDIATSFLMKHGFSIKIKNFRVPGGELDIVAAKGDRIHFIEVKSVSVADVTLQKTVLVRPEDHFTYEKARKTLRAARIYMSHYNISQETPHQVDLACVYISEQPRQATVRYFTNVVTK